MSKLDEYLGGSARSNYEKATWHTWKPVTQENGQPKLEKKKIWDFASKSTVDAWLTAFEPIKGTFEEVWAFDDPKNGNTKIGVKVRTDRGMVAFSTTSKKVGLTAKRFSKGDYVTITRFGEGTRTIYEFESKAEVQNYPPDESFPQDEEDPKWVQE